MQHVPQAPTASDNLIGRRIDGRYRIERMIARGSMGRVYLAEQEPLGRQVVLKILDMNDSMELLEDRQARFLKEAETLARLTHNHIVRIYDFGVADGLPYIAMEHISGPTLGRRMKKGLTPLQSLDVALQITRALEHAHHRDVIHRDLKPANVLFEPGESHEEMTVKVVDFGLAKSRGPSADQTQVGILVGTPLYMSPEQSKGSALDGRSDIYSVGVLLFEMLTGTRLFGERQDNMAILLAHTSEQPPTLALAQPNQRFPEVLEWTVATCLAKRPEERFQDPAQLIQALQICCLALQDPAIGAVPLRLRDGALILPETVAGLLSSSLRMPTGATAVSQSILVQAPKKKTPWVPVLVCVTLLAAGLAVLGLGGPEEQTSEAPLTPPAPAAILTTEIVDEAPSEDAADQPPATPDAPAEDPSAEQAPREPSPRTEAPAPEPAPRKPTRSRRRAPRSPAPEPAPAAPAAEPNPQTTSPVGAGSDLVDPWKE